MAESRNVLFLETAAGYAFYSVKTELMGGLEKVAKAAQLGTAITSLEPYGTFESISKVHVVALASFHPFSSPQHAAQEYRLYNDRSLPDLLKKALLAEIRTNDTLILTSKLAVTGDEYGICDWLKSQGITTKLIGTLATFELGRCIRLFEDSFLAAHVPSLKKHANALAHNLYSTKLRMRPQIDDQGLIQAIEQLDKIDLEVVKASMDLLEWYSLYCPELKSVVWDHRAYLRLVATFGTPQAIASQTPGQISIAVGGADVRLATKIIEAAKLTVGRALDEDTTHRLMGLAAKNLLAMEERSELMTFISKKTQAIMPCTAIICGELIAARLLAKAGSLLQLARFPASTIQILGAEKALFRALMTRTNTPKYGILYHCSLVGMAPPLLKGWIAHRIAAKASLASRLDAFRDESQDFVYKGKEMRDLLQAQLTKQIASIQARNTIRAAAAAAQIQGRLWQQPERDFDYEGQFAN